jgi:hypothetical protein
MEKCAMRRTKPNPRPIRPIDPAALLLSIPQSARVLGISQSLLFAGLANGTFKIPVRKLSGRSVIAVDDLRAFAAALPVRQTGEGGQ